jgi:D-alanyl-D-alanine dipeptidase
MGSYFDEFNEHAHHSHGRDISDDDHEWALSDTYHIHEYTARKLRELLKSLMADIGLLPYEEEWWHYYDPDLVK